MEVPAMSEFSISLLISGINTPSCATYLVTKPEFVLGKADSCDAVMSFSEEISREHAKINWNPDGYTITDLNSTNGTFLNGMTLRPNEPQTLVSGDRIGISTFLFSIEMIKR